MLADDGRAVLMDFGTGRELADNFSSDVAGTPLYLAPEILAGGDATVQSDIYSLGVLLYYLVTGSYPVRAETVSDLRLAHQRNERIRIRTARGGSDLSPKLVRIIERAIDPRPDDRYASADALAADLATLQPRPTLARLPYAIAAAAVLLLIAGLGWEAVGRRVGSSRTPGALLAGVAGWNAGAAAHVIPSQPIIAVLPFENLSDEPESDDFVDGLTDEIIRNLGVIQGLQVRSRDSSFAFKDKPRNLRDVGQQLDVNLVVEGSVLRSGNKLARQRATDSGRRGCPPVVRSVRSGAQGHLRHSGRHLADDRQQAATDGWPEASGDTTRMWRCTSYTSRAARWSVVQVVPISRRPRKCSNRSWPRILASHLLTQGWRSRMRSCRCLPAAPSRSWRPNRSSGQPPSKRTSSIRCWLTHMRLWVGCMHATSTGRAPRRPSERAIDLNPGLSQTYTGYSTSTLRPLGKQDDALRFLRVALQNDPLSLNVQREIGFVQIENGQVRRSHHHAPSACARSTPTFRSQTTSSRERSCSPGDRRKRYRCSKERSHLGRKDGPEGREETPGWFWPMSG